MFFAESQQLNAVHAARMSGIVAGNTNHDVLSGIKFFSVDGKQCLFKRHLCLQGMSSEALVETQSCLQYPGRSEATGEGTLTEIVKSSHRAVFVIKGVYKQLNESVLRKLLALDETPSLKLR